MSLYYIHTLIPDQSDFVPAPTQVAGFYSVLTELGAAPSAAAFAIITPNARTSYAGRVPGRTGRNPMTGEAVVVPPRYECTINDTPSVALELDGLNEYDLKMSGKGPPRLVPFRFDDKLNPQGQAYDFAVHCCRRPHIASTSDYHFDLNREGLKVTPFGDACYKTQRTGFFINHKTAETIRVPNAGCARFWIEFAFGEWLFPEMKGDSLNLLAAPIVVAAQQEFSVGFAQGCCWG